MPGLLAPSSAADFPQIPLGAKLCLKLSMPLILGFDSRPEGERDPEDLLKFCLTGVKAAVRLQIIPEPDCTRVVLANFVLLELRPPLL